MEGETFVSLDENGQLNEKRSALAARRKQEWNAVFNHYMTVADNTAMSIENITDNIEYVISSICEDDMSESQMSDRVERSINSVIHNVSNEYDDEDITERRAGLPVPKLPPCSFNVVNDKDISKCIGQRQHNFSDQTEEGVVTNMTDGDDLSNSIDEEMLNEFDDGKLTIKQIATFVGKKSCEKELRKALIREYVKEVNSTFTEEEVAAVVVFIEHKRTGRNLRAAAKALNSEESRNDPTMYRKARDDMKHIVQHLLQYMSVKLLCLYGNFFVWSQQGLRK